MENEKRIAKNKRGKQYRESHKEDTKKYRESHKEDAKKYRESHKEDAKRYHQNNKINAKKYYQNHKEEIKINAKKYYQMNKEKNKEKRKEYINTQLKTNMNFKLAHYLRNRLRIALYNNQKAGSAVKDLGCPISELKLYLESKFQPGMSWDNWSKTGWHIDHIKPLASFNLQNRKEFLKACHYTNLQPLWAEDNLSKNNK